LKKSLGFALPGLVAAPRQQSRDRDVFVQILPVETARAQFKILELFPTCV
jgi:hypothetical protein